MNIRLLIALLGVVIATTGGVLSQDVDQVRPILGTIRDDQPYITYPLTIGEDRAGWTIAADMEALDGSLDPALYLIDADGQIIDENDDLSADTLDARIRYLSAPPGDYTVIATRWRVTDGETIGNFRLTVALLPPTSTQRTPYAVDDATLTDLGYPQMDPRPRADWTVLAYYGGDTDLEAGIVNDLNEFEMAGGSTESVRVVALLDRSPAFEGTPNNWQTARLFEVEADVSGDHEDSEIATIDSTPLADLGEINTGDGETLAQFLVWAMKTYPADRYAVVFASHGAGWRGVIADDTGLYSLMSVPELQQALRTSLDATGADGFDLLINDACSMGSVEYHTAMSEFFDMSIASPEIVVNPALDMALLADQLNADPDRDLGQLGATLIDKYIEVDVPARPGLEGNFLMHAVIDLNETLPIVDTVNVFAKLVLRNPDAYATTIGQARANAYVYSAFIGDSTTIDLGHFMRQVIANTDDPALVAAAEDVLAALDAARIYGSAAPIVADRTTYHSIYFPEKSRNFNLEYLNDSPLKAWGQMLRSYYNAITPRLWDEAEVDRLAVYHPPMPPRVTVTGVYPAVSNVNQPPSIRVEIVGRRIANGALTIDRVGLDGVAYRLAEAPIVTEVVTETSVSLLNNWKSGVDQSVFNWLPLELPVIVGGDVESTELLRRQGQTISLEGRWRATPDADWADVSVLFNEDGAMQGVISRGAGGTLAEIRIPAGSQFQAYRYRVTLDGELAQEPGTSYTWPEGGLRWESRTAASGTYNLGFVVSAFGGSTDFDSTTVIVDNTDFDTTRSGYADIGLGLTFQRPSDWSPIVDLGGWLTATSPDGDAALNVYYFRAEDNVWEIKRQVQRRYGFQQVGQTQYFRERGDLALRFRHQYTTEDGDLWTGEAVVFHRQTSSGGRGIIFSVDTRNTTDAARDALFDALLADFKFFDAGPLDQRDSSEWTYRFINGRIAYPVRETWATAPEQDGVWTIYRPLETPVRLAAVADVVGDRPARVRDDLLRDLGVTDATRITYEGEYRDWEAASYTIERQGVPVVGRLYATTFNNRVYALRIETRDDSIAEDVFRATFEPMVDGFAPTGTIDYARGSRTAFVQAAVISANDTCAGDAWGTLCSDGLPVEAIYETDGEIISRVIDDTATADDLLAFRVGQRDDGTIDPFSVAVLTIQANLPDDRPDDTVKLIVFGGATVVNRALLPPDQIESVTMAPFPEVTTDRINIRSWPAPNAYIIGSLGAEQPVQAVARTEDNIWLRVRLPNDPSRTGWVSRHLLVPLDAPYFTFTQLPVGDPAEPHLKTMQRIEVLLPHDTDGALNGLLIGTSTGAPPVDIRINGELFQVPGGSLVFWRGDRLDPVTEAEQSDIFDDTSSRRRPSSWSSSILSDSVRERLANTPLTFGQFTAVAVSQPDADLGAMFDELFDATDD